MVSDAVLPMRLLPEGEGTWEEISRVIKEHLLPRLDQKGSVVFRWDSQEEGKKETQYLYPPISRPAPVLAYQISGRSLSLVGRKVFRTGPGEGFFVRPGVKYVPHISEDGKVPASQWLWFACFPSGVLLNQCRTGERHHLSSPYFFVPDPTLSDLLRHWNPENGDSEKGRIVLMAFFSILADGSPLPRARPDNGPDLPRDLPQPLRIAIAWMARYYDQPFRLQYLADQCFVSPGHLCRLFRQHLGQTPWGYLTKLRLTSAESLLKGTNLTLRRICELVGFRDLRHFRRQFRKEFGVPPSAMR
ncbi:MAG: AraC family transcriptional regulator [Armatimonadetes bacterium]|nr:AraC family transcriptional regulator [Armatimonadota bacterium]MDW8121624.1 AraC family transcriptional regulator [Armatimonadota bacterium]